LIEREHPVSNCLKRRDVEKKPIPDTESVDVDKKDKQAARLFSTKYFPKSF
jgi:hypothetical protein